jgi:hypothetical protein
MGELRSGFVQREGVIAGKVVRVVSPLHGSLHGVKDYNTNLQNVRLKKVFVIFPFVIYF